MDVPTPQTGKGTGTAGKWGWFLFFLFAGGLLLAFIIGFTRKNPYAWMGEQGSKLRQKVQPSAPAAN